MHWLWILIGGVVLVVVSTLLFTDTVRTVKSLILISKTSPYEQVGSGEKRLLLLGDSTGYGTGVKDNKLSIAGRIGTDFPEITIANNSVNGRRLDQLVADMPALEGKYTVVLLQMGANDILQQRTLRSTISDLEALYKKLSPHTEHIVMMTSGNIGGAVAYDGTDKGKVLEQLSREYYAGFEEFARTHPNFTFVNLFEERENDKFIQASATYMAMDGLHPSEAGYGLWYDKLQPVLRPLLFEEESL